MVEIGEPARRSRARYNELNFGRLVHSASAGARARYGDRRAARDRRAPGSRTPRASGSSPLAQGEPLPDRASRSRFHEPTSRTRSSPITLRNEAGHTIFARCAAGATAADGPLRAPARPSIVRIALRELARPEPLHAHAVGRPRRRRRRRARRCARTSRRSIVHGTRATGGDRRPAAQLFVEPSAGEAGRGGEPSADAVAAVTSAARQTRQDDDRRR